MPQPRHPFPWIRAIAVSIILMLVTYLSFASVLSVGHAMDPIWSYIATPLIGLITVSIYVFQYFFPLAPVGTHQPSTQSNSSRSQLNQPTSTRTNTVIFPYNYPSPPSADEVFGRMQEKMTFISRTRNGGVTAINGPRRIGKTWLMCYLKLVAPTQLDANYRVGIMSATHPECLTLAGFVKRALEALNVPTHSLPASNIQLRHFANAIQDLKAQQIVPVLCIDEFEGFSGKPWFDGAFVEGLRAIAQDDGLVLVVAAKKTLREIVEGLISQTSQLYGMVHQLPLRPFSEAEANDFVTRKAQQAGFNNEEQQFLQECAPIYSPDGKKIWYPLRLQFVGQMLLADKDEAQIQHQPFQVQDQTYRADFKQRLNEQWQAVVKEP